MGYKEPRIKGVRLPRNVLYAEIEKEKARYKGHVIGISMELWDAVERIAIKYGNAKVRMSSHMRKLKNIKEVNRNEILDIINSENSGLSHQQRLNEIEKLLNK